MSPRQYTIAAIGAVLILASPFAFVMVLATSQSEIEKSDVVEVGEVETALGSKVSIYVMLGDVLHPRETNNHLGFDLVPVSYYFDPVRIDNYDVLIRSPLLDSALKVASRNEEELEYFLRELSLAIYQYVDNVPCDSRVRSIEWCEGDQIVPRIWPAHGATTVDGPLGVKYIAAIPLFDPNAATAEGIHSADIRRALRDNLKDGVRRTLSLAADEYHGTIRSVAFAALGSTSHKGGDARAFLDFKSGFLTILDSVIKSRPPLSVDRMYFVGYSKHTGIYRRETLGALVHVSRYLSLMNIVSENWAVILRGAIFVGFFMLGIATYQRFFHYFNKNNRWLLVTTILGGAVPLGEVSFRVLNVSFEPIKYEMVFVLHFVVSSLCICVVPLLSKQIGRGKPS